MKKRLAAPVLVVIMALTLCTSVLAAADSSVEAPGKTGCSDYGMSPDFAYDKATALAGGPALTRDIAGVQGRLTSVTPLADNIQSNSKAKVDITNIANGYVKIAYTGGGTARIKTIITGPKGTDYKYDLNNNGNYETFPLSEGDGTYKVGVYVNVSGTSYSTAYTTSFSVKLKNQFAPFLVSNKYVNYGAAPKTVEQAASLTKGETDDIKKLEKVYNYVITNFTYDKQLAQTVKSDYVPNLDTVLAAKKGICYDYASLMTGMLRSQGIACKLVFGYTKDAYHAWIDAYIPSVGWVGSAIYFDGATWKLMDPTFASCANSSDDIMKYIGNGSNYSAKYYY